MMTIRENRLVEELIGEVGALMVGIAAGMVNNLDVNAVGMLSDVKTKQVSRRVSGFLGCAEGEFAEFGNESPNTGVK